MPDYPPYIFGMHDRGAEHLLRSKPGWVLVTEGIGADPNNHQGGDYTDLSSQGFGVIVRLNNGYGSAGTIPHSAEYDNFARRCGNFVQASRGCHIWIIGNEMNLANERPGGPNGQAITPDLYAACFRRCRAEIRSRPGHENDQVVIGAVGPWNIETRYPGNESGDWVRYFADILNLLGEEVDGIALHTYTHGQEPHLVFSDTTMNPPFQNYHWHFRAYRDFMAAIPEDLRDRPVYITETDQYNAWRDENTGWVRNAYREIDDWNRDANNQPIQALILYRWIVGNPHDPQQVGWAIENKPGVQDDLRAAMRYDYHVVLPHGKPDYLVAWLAVDVPGRMEARGQATTLQVTVRNEGRLSWEHSGDQAVRLGHRWIDAQGSVLEGPRTDLPRDVAPGETLTLSGVSIPTPTKPGYYTLELDMVQGYADWFSATGSPVWRQEDVQVGPRYRVAWLRVDAPTEGTAGETVTFPVVVRNEGALTWPPDGANPVNLTYKWLDADHNVLVADGLRTPIGREVAPWEEVSLEARVQFPAERGDLILQLDMVHEFVAWFQWKGSPVHETPVQVRPALPDYAAEWPTYSGPDRLVAGQEGQALLEIKNTGALPWPHGGEGAIRLGYRWLDAQGNEVAVPGAETCPLPKTVAPGETVTLRDVAFIAPSTPDAYRLVWDLVQGGEWLSERGVAVLERSVQVVAPDYAVEWNLLTPWPTRLPPATEQHMGLRLRNTGARTWAAQGEQPVHLAYTWFTAAGELTEPWDTFRILLPGDVAPGQAVDLPDIPFRTPPLPGEYLLRWDLVEEGVTWFFRRGAAPLERTIEISEEAIYPPWTARASHNAGAVTLAFDGDPTTFWDSGANQEPGMWFQVDLGQVLVLDRVRVQSPGRGFPVGYKIKLSTDGQDWHLVAEKPHNWTDIDAAFAPCPARYVHLEQTGTPDWPATWMIGEISVSATEPWAGAEASHYGDYASQAVDARLRTYWNTRAVKQKPGMWFQVDMGSPRRIEGVTLIHPTGQQPRGYVVLVSADGQNWQEVGRNDDNWGMLDVRFAAVTARYVRVETTNSSPWHPWGISEFVIWRASPLWIHGRGGGE